jgi:lipoprotein-anchoring transpeptidase ErfK/SrfK
MERRFLTGVVCAAGLAVVLSLASTDAMAQRRPANYDDTVAGTDPVARFFGMSTSPIARTTVSYPGNQRPGTIVINTRERRLYLVLGNGQALRYGIGVGRDGFRWGGATRVSAKREWPDWTPPEQMRRRRPDLPAHMAGGPDNPLGARALYLGSSLYRIHGSNEPETIGQAVSSGCFRLTNEDVIDLYGRVQVGATVIVQQ